MRSTVRDAVVVARRQARQKGAARFTEEADALGITVTATPSAVAALARDWDRATVLARRYADRWAQKAEEFDSAAKASAATQGSLERIAVSESSDAFSDGRSRLAEAIEAPTVELLKAWDATLDRRTCPTCDAADGTIVGILESFPAGEPGSVHAFCRCTWTLLTMSESKGSVLIKRP